MKRFLSLICFFSFLGLSAPGNAAVRNFCQAQKAELKAVTKGDQEYSLCSFGQALVGAETLYQATKKESSPEAVSAFKKGSTVRTTGGVCGSFGATLLEVKDHEGNSINLCRFTDGSIIEETTLWLGPDSLIGEKLGRLLSKMNKS